ncbi:Dfp1/Him1, central region-domain-containing protein [Neurospora tetraspora]|uniref:Dfp1/Him1, central region-domain-containing protein n=1 Tax=Neurospora tetraspora TaxID=94610 RepID=A0AAE0JDE0_9PEZI|nr:Dfp1/Him1, central region-domain-containing protein [Neurospora tetraspora]
MSTTTTAASGTKRAPLSDNPNAANSPLRGSSATALALQGSKKAVRSHADQLREEPYGQPPPAKRQMIEHGGQRAAASPTSSRSNVSNVTRKTSTMSRTAERERAERASSRTSTTATSTRAERSHASTTTTTDRITAKELEDLSIWQTSMRSRFHKMVFYFESIPDEQRHKLAKQVAQLGAREEKFFSIEITHVVTTRPIPPVRPVQDENQPGTSTQSTSEQPKTIDPSLLNRNGDSVRRKLIFDKPSIRKSSVQPQEETMPKPKARSTDILHRARDMGKKIWSLDKLQRILGMVLETDLVKAALLGRGHTPQAADRAKARHQTANVLQMLQNERVHGPSDRDPTVVTKDIHYFKGPYIYVYDIEEKTRPVMVREYHRVADKKDGEWPQFRVASQGRCPFVEDYDPPERTRRERAQAKEKVTKAADTAAATEKAAATKTLQPPEVPSPKPVTGKRTLNEMEAPNDRAAEVVDDAPETVESTKESTPSVDFRSQNAFMSYTTKVGRLVAGEPVASGIQANKLTSAIRSQMVSSTTGVLGAKAGISKEVLGLQRKVLQKASVPSLSQDSGARRLAEIGVDGNPSCTRAASLGNPANPPMPEIWEDDEARKQEQAKKERKLRRTASTPAPQTKPKPRDPKPGYCENCQDKFEDFDAHIVSRKHRRFAENDDNWAQLDALLGKLSRAPREPRYRSVDDERWQ